MAKKPKQKTSEKLKGMADALARMVPKPIQPRQPAQPAQPPKAPEGFAEQVIERVRKDEPKAKQATFRYHERPKNYTRTFLVRMTGDAHLRLMRASYVLFKGATDITREAINKHLADLEAEYQKKTGKPFPPTPDEQA